MKAYIRSLKTATEKLTTWEDTGKAFGHLGVLDTVADENRKSDRLYEFYCLMRVLEDLSHFYDIELIPSKYGINEFPQSPGEKQNFAKFEVHKKGNSANAYQVCFGTKIRLSFAGGTTVSPDISFQAIDATDDPDESMVELILDAKYRNDPSRALSIETIRGFSAIVEDLGISRASSLPLSFAALSSIKGNCLLTNGEVIFRHEAYCKHRSMKQVGKFDLGGNPIDVVG